MGGAGIYRDAIRGMADHRLAAQNAYHLVRKNLVNNKVDVSNLPTASLSNPGLERDVQTSSMRSYYTTVTVTDFCIIVRHCLSQAEYLLCT